MATNLRFGTYRHMHPVGRPRSNEFRALLIEFRAILIEFLGRPTQIDRISSNFERLSSNLERLDRIAVGRLKGIEFKANFDQI